MCFHFDCYSIRVAKRMMMLVSNTYERKYGSIYCFGLFAANAHFG